MFIASPFHKALSLGQEWDQSEIECIAANRDFEIGKSSLMMRACRVLGPAWIVGAVFVICAWIEQINA